jgi:hypothetical protein
VHTAPLGDLVRPTDERATDLWSRTGLGSAVILSLPLSPDSAGDSGDQEPAHGQGVRITRNPGLGVVGRRPRS